MLGVKGEKLRQEAKYTGFTVWPGHPRERGSMTLCTVKTHFYKCALLGRGLLHRNPLRWVPFLQSGPEPAPGLDPDNQLSEHCSSNSRQGR